MIDLDLWLERYLSGRNIIVVHAVAFCVWCVWVLWLASPPAHAQDFPYGYWRHNSGLDYAIRATHYSHRYAPYNRTYYRTYREDDRDRGERAKDREIRMYRSDIHEQYDERRDVDCKASVRGLGTEWIGQEGALQAAWKDWMERVRYDHGEKYLDQTNADHIESRCGRVSVGKVAGQVMYRCEVVANPCKADYKEVATPESATAPLPEPQAQQ